MDDKFTFRAEWRAVERIGEPVNLAQGGLGIGMKEDDKVTLTAR